MRRQAANGAAIAPRRLMLIGLPALAVAATLALVSTGSSPPPAARAAAVGVVRASYYGVNGQLAFAQAAPGRWRASAAAIAAIGVGTVRRDVFWSAVEPSRPQRRRHRYHWRLTDRLVTVLAEHGLRWYPIVDYGTSWASVPGPHAPPTAAHVPDYAAFAGALAHRYGRKGRFWRLHPRLRALPVHAYEIWNEPNVRHFWSGASDAPERLAAMYLAARTRIRAADRSARVVLGGLSVVGVDDFLTRMVRAHPRLVGRLDAVGFHPYGGGASGGLRVTYDRIRLLRSVLDRLLPSPRVPIEITETGWAVPPVPEAWRAERLRQLAIALPGSGCDVTRFIVHTWTSTETGPSPEAWFGIAHADGTLTPSGEAFRAGIAAMRSATPPAPERIC